VLLHELAHVRSGDWLMVVVSHIVCALYWFHPGAWWIARGLRRECEFACDNSVLSAGIKPSDYAELLAMAADSLPVPSLERAPVLALSRHAGLRERLHAVLDTGRDVRAPGMVRHFVAAALVLVVAIPTGAVRLAPTREALAQLMLDARWESRAYAVLGLAQRPDSVATAREAASTDPSPRVRAWARYALDRQNSPIGF
jgi:beta-lactamase regulating signal transducer with metallopeptidase domain